MRLLLQVESVAEGATELNLFALPGSPVRFARLLFGADLSDGGVALGRLAGIALLTVAIGPTKTGMVDASGID